MKKAFKLIRRKLNIPLVIFLLLVGLLLLIANIKSKPFKQVKETVNETVDKVSENINQVAHDSSSSSIADS